MGQRWRCVCERGSVEQHGEPRKHRDAEIRPHRLVARVALVLRSPVGSDWMDGDVSRDIRFERV